MGQSIFAHWGRPQGFRWPTFFRVCHFPCLHVFHAVSIALTWPHVLVAENVETAAHATAVVNAFFAPVALPVHDQGYLVGVTVVDRPLLPVVIGTVAFEVANPGHPTFAASPNACYLSNLSSYAALAGTVIVDGSMGAPANYAPCNHPSSPRGFLGKMWVRFGNSSNLNHSCVSGTNDLPKDATTSHLRNRCPHPHQEPRRHTYPAALSTPAARRIQ